MAEGPETIPGEISLFMLGKTGHGKSSTGNTILGRDCFNTSDGGESDTFITQSAWGRFGQRVVKVVDGPGLCETRLRQGESAKKMLDDMRRGLFLCPDGFDGLVLVLRFGIRFTKEELEAVKTLKSVFGPDFLKDYGVIVLTHGEQLDMENQKKKTKKSLAEWVSDQKGELQELLRECQGRHVLFHNMDDTKRDGTVSELLKLVDELKRRGRRYTTDLFEKIKAEHDKYFTRENATELKEKMQKKVDLLQCSLSRVIVMNDSSNVDMIKAQVDQLLKDAWELKQEISREDRQTGVLESLMKHAENIECTLSSQRAALEDKRKTEAVQAERLQLVARMESMQEELTQLRADSAPKESVDYAQVITCIGAALQAAVVIAKLMNQSEDGEQAPSSTPQITEVTSSDDED